MAKSPEEMAASMIANLKEKTGKTLDAWLKIARDGVVTVAVPQLEMGQGVTTILPQIVAKTCAFTVCWA